MQNNVCPDKFDMGICMLLHVWAKKKKSKMLYINYGQKWGDDIIKSLICMYQLFKKCFVENYEYLPYFLSDFNQIFTILFENFYSIELT